MTIWVGKLHDGLNAYTRTGDWHLIDCESGDEIWNVIWADDYKQQYIQNRDGEEVLVEKYLNAVNTGNLSEAKKYCVDQSAQNIDKISNRIAVIPGYKILSLEETVRGDRAIVEYRGSDDGNQKYVTLLKTSSGWKIYPGEPTSLIREARWLRLAAQTMYLDGNPTPAESGVKTSREYIELMKKNGALTEEISPEGLEELKIANFSKEDGEDTITVISRNYNSNKSPERLKSTLVREVIVCDKRGDTHNWQESSLRFKNISANLPNREPAILP